ncbi:MAG TPA: hypothetical protein VK574_18610 [Terracidiphilus sp.]|nr:hypothetical protein [Terracidiphilus sp.]
MITKHKDLLAAVCESLKGLEEAIGPRDPAVIEAKRVILVRLAELHMIDSLDDASLLASLPNLPRQ